MLNEGRGFWGVSEQVSLLPPGLLACYLCGQSICSSPTGATGLCACQESQHLHHNDYHRNSTLPQPLHGLKHIRPTGFWQNGLEAALVKHQPQLCHLFREGVDFSSSRWLQNPVGVDEGSLGTCETYPMPVFWSWRWGDLAKRRFSCLVCVAELLHSHTCWKSSSPSKRIDSVLRNSWSWRETPLNYSVVLQLQLLGPVLTRRQLGNHSPWNCVKECMASWGKAL